jgi:hypothetical protein
MTPRKSRSQALVAIRKTDALETAGKVLVAESQLQKFATELTLGYRQIVRHYLAYGQRLRQIKRLVGHGAFGRMFKSHANPIARPVPFTQRTAEMLMTIAGNPLLANPNSCSHLPHSWRTAYALARVPPSKLEQAFAVPGLIYPEMPMHEVRYIKGVPRPPEPDPENAERLAKQRIQDTIRGLWTRYRGQRGFLVDYVQQLAAEETRYTTTH